MRAGRAINMTNMKGDRHSQFLLILLVTLIGGGIMFAFYENIALLFADPAEAGYLRGARDFKDGEYQKALASYEKSLAANSGHIASAHGRAESLIMLGRYEEALAAFSQALRLAPDSATAHANRAILLDRMGRYEEALRGYRQALEMDPEIGEGPGFLTRFLRNQPEELPGIAARSKYIEEQLSLPPERRQLANPEEDARQRPYTK